LTVRLPLIRPRLKARERQASTAFRPYVRDDREAPLRSGRDGLNHTTDLRFWKSEIFFAEALDVISEKQHDGQISSAIACRYVGYRRLRT
jgi:hypothetical protein